MLAAGVYDLGLTAAQFSSFTPRHIDAFYKRHLQSEERQDRRIGALMALYAEAHRDRDKRSEPFTVDDFCGTSRFQTVVRAVELGDDFAGLTPEEKMQRMIDSERKLSPEQQIAQIYTSLQGHAFGKWTVENA